MSAPNSTRVDFNPLTPCGVRQSTLDMLTKGAKFQSTHPVWGETLPALLQWYKLLYFNPLTPCGVRPTRAVCTSIAARNFNPLTPCGVRHRNIDFGISQILFQSTHPVWGETVCAQAQRTSASNFNPLTPCVVRLARQDRRKT